MLYDSYSSICNLINVKVQHSQCEEKTLIESNHVSDVTCIADRIYLLTAFEEKNFACVVMNVF